ncbi:substrate-binding domain-containing protein [Rhizobium esperanzae]|uniref:D-xylose transport system substrate-binding protein n=1 Tax=Rhizobium esperanzae TaxID=1967781 RepID=A0A7W6R110_9HYPH|nr:substrate-binding domain-containing protein [Rhizobium esperanzae]MBB4234744.1 D-xylose transport system substrate-binding protein [Rhizobium esperanzae]
MKKKLMTALFAASTAWSVLPAKAAEPTGTVYLLLPNVTTNRFDKFDVPNVTAAMKTYAPGIEVKVLNANDDMQQQVSQAESAIASGALGIILVSVDPPRSASILAKADNDGIPVVTYAHDPGPGPVAYHVSVPFADIGDAQGKWLSEHLPEHRPVRLAYMLGDPKFAFYTEQMKGFDKYMKPLIDNGTVQVVCQADALLYLASNAQKNMEQCLTKTDNGVDGVVVMNDDTGGGVIAALSGQDLVGKVRVFGGYDATLEGIQRVLLGWQAADMSPPYKGMADAAVQLLVSKIKNADAPKGLINGAWPNKFTDGGVPARLEPNIFITADNVQNSVIDSGLYTRDEICSGIGKDAEFCKK